jgi:hypothetical protein
MVRCRRDHTQRAGRSPREARRNAGPESPDFAALDPGYFIVIARLDRGDASFGVG